MLQPSGFDCASLAAVQMMLKFEFFYFDPPSR